MEEEYIIPASVKRGKKFGTVFEVSVLLHYKGTRPGEFEEFACLLQE